jgi:hypothetical protein
VAGNELETVSADLVRPARGGFYKLRLVATKKTDGGIQSTVSPEALWAP